MTQSLPRRSTEALASARRALAEPARPRGRSRELLAAALLMAMSGAGAAAAMILGPGVVEGPVGRSMGASGNVGLGGAPYVEGKLTAPR